MTKEVICPVCEGHGFSPIIGEYSITSHTCDHCNGSGLIKVPMTNADRIRAMSDEELVDFLLTEEWECDTYNSCSVCPFRGEKGCISLLQWLKQPVEDIKAQDQKGVTCHNCNGTDEPEHYQNKKYCPNCGTRVD